MEQKDKKVPFHRRFGLRLLQVLLIVFCMILVKRCVNIYYDNKGVDEQVVVEYFEKGFANGRKKAMGLAKDPEPLFKKYAFKKAYRDGYRQGWDSRSKQDNQD